MSATTTQDTMTVPRSTIVDLIAALDAAGDLFLHEDGRLSGTAREQAIMGTAGQVDAARIDRGLGAVWTFGLSEHPGGGLASEARLSAGGGGRGKAPMTSKATHHPGTASLRVRGAGVDLERSRRAWSGGGRSMPEVASAAVGAARGATG